MHHISTLDPKRSKSHSAPSALFLSHQHVKEQDASSSVGGGGLGGAGDLSPEWTAGPSIHRTTSLRLHLQKQSHPLLIDVWIIELSPGFSCFSRSSLRTAVIVLYFTLTPFTTKDILMCICVNILPGLLSGRRRDADSRTGARQTTSLSWLINLRGRAACYPAGSAAVAAAPSRHHAGSPPAPLSISRRSDR